MTPDALEAWVGGILAGRRREVARAISEVENETGAGGALLKELLSHTGRARVLGVTGPPGAGKSTLVNALIAELRQRGQRIGVVAVDPSSPFSGGAILGDRVRMTEQAAADDVFIRSLASRGHLGGLSRATARVIDVLDAAGYETIIVETVGAGQSEVEIAELADTLMVVCPPGLGDDVQAIKAGILEVADVFVVNKSDLPGAERTQRELLAMLALRAPSSWRPPVVRTAALSGQGVAQLADACQAHGEHVRREGRRKSGVERPRRVLANLAAESLRRRLHSLDLEELDQVARLLETGQLDWEAAADRAIAIVAAQTY